MKKWLHHLIMLSSALMCLLVTLVPSEAEEMTAAFNDEYLVLLDAPTPTDFRNRLKTAEFNARKEKILAAVPKEFAVSHSLGHLPMSVLKSKNPEALKRLKRQPGVLAVYPNRRIYHQLTESLPLIRQEYPVANGYGGHGATIAIVDTGINFLNRSEFGDCVGIGDPASCRVIESIDIAADDGTYDSNGHGTHVAAIAAAVAPQADLVAIDVFDGSSSSDALVIAGINWAISHQADYQIAVINLSLGDQSYNTAPCGNHLTNPYVTAVNNARTAGIMVVVAAGNEGYTDAISRPACTPKAVSVGAVYDANVGGLVYATCSDLSTAADQVTCFSNSADFMSLWAPGALITAAGGIRAGTSQAAPHVSGVLAALRSAYPSDSLDQTTARLLTVTTTVTDSRNGVNLPRLNMEEALNIPDAATIPGMGLGGALLCAMILSFLPRKRHHPPSVSNHGTTYQ